MPVRTYVSNNESIVGIIEPDIVILLVSMVINSLLSVVTLINPLLPVSVIEIEVSFKLTWFGKKSLP